MLTTSAALDTGWLPTNARPGELLDAHLKYASHLLHYSAFSLTASRKQGTPLSLVVNLDVSDQVILSRISDRWVHLPSGRVYNMSYNRPKVDGLDDETGEPLTKRPDDNPVRVPFPFYVNHVADCFFPGNLRKAARQVLLHYFSPLILLYHMCD